MYFITIKYWDGNIREHRSDFGVINHSTLEKRITTIESFLYSFLARSRDTGTPAKITSVWELRFPFKIRKMKALLQAMN